MALTKHSSRQEWLGHLIVLEAQLRVYMEDIRQWLDNKVSTDWVDSALGECAEHDLHTMRTIFREMKDAREQQLPGERDIPNTDEARH